MLPKVTDGLRIHGRVVKHAAVVIMFSFLGALLSGCGSLMISGVQSVEEGHQRLSQQLEKKYQKPFTYSNEKLWVSDGGNVFTATVVGVDDNPQIRAGAKLDRYGKLLDTYSGVGFRSRVEGPANEACAMAGKGALTCVAVMDLPPSVERWDNLSFEDFIAKSGVTVTVDVTYPLGLTDDQLADYGWELVTALHNTQIRSFFRVKQNGDALYSLNVYVGSPLPYDRSLIIDYLSVFHGRVKSR